MPAIPVLPKGAHSQELRALLGQQGIFERGDHIYLQTPVQRFRPSSDQVEEFAAAKAGLLKAQAPNENLVWFKGQYVEADVANGNGAQWHAKELAIKSLTPMLMPVTVMHDPRTAVGTIADVQMLTPEKDKVPRARIDTVLALWGHRFPEAVHEAEANADAGTLMQSMECYSPHYSCSECGQVFHKLPRGAEQAMWCEHLRASNPSAGYVDLSAQGAGAQTSNASRILGDVCFTGTGLIFGTRGAKGAHPDAYLSNFEEELASWHQGVHRSTAAQRSERMGLVQIEDTELATLRQERDAAKAETAQEREKRQEAERAAETAEAAKVAAEAERDSAKAEVTAKNEELAKEALKKQRFGALGEGFTAKMGEFTKRKLDELAGTASDEAWEAEIAEKEELLAVKRDAKKDGTSADAAANGNGNGNGNGHGDEMFEREELARLGLGGNGSGDPTASRGPTAAERGSVVTSLAGAFKKK